MSDLIVPTHFEDVSQLAEGLVDRVDEQRLILYGPAPFEEGAEITFAVLLLDGSPAFEGTARVAASIDGGEERAPETRFDVVLDSLRFAGTGEVVYERILLARDSGVRGDPPTGEVDVVELEEHGEVPAEDATAIADYSHDPALAELAASAGSAADEAGPMEPDPTDEPREAAQPVGYPAVDEPSAEAADPADVAEPAAHEEVYPEPAEEGTPEYAEPSPMAEAGAEVYAAAEPEPEPEPEPELDGWDSEVDPAEVASLPDGDSDPVHVPVDDEGTREVSLDDVEEVPAAAAAPPLPGGAASVPPSRPAPSMPEAPGGFQVMSLGGNGALTRPAMQPSWFPEVEPMPDPHPSTGLFAYGGSVPIPPRPPRPDMDPSYRIGPAPRPEGGMEAEAMASSAMASVPMPEASADHEAAPVEEGFADVSTGEVEELQPDAHLDADADVEELEVGADLSHDTRAEVLEEGATQHEIGLPEDSVEEMVDWTEEPPDRQD